jgi:hypothetical protein
MKTIIRIIEEAGGLAGSRYIPINNEPWMRLVIEVLAESGPDGLPVVSVCHYGEQNSDLMRDPEVLFEAVINDGLLQELRPFYFRNDYVGIERWSRQRSDRGELICKSGGVRELEQFAQLWDRNLDQQGFLEAFRRCRLEHDGGSR